MKITFNDGETAVLETLFQWYAYKDILEGGPGLHVNKALVDGAKRVAEEHFKHINHIFIDPGVNKVRRKFLNTREYPYSKYPQSIPAIACIAEFGVQKTGESGYLEEGLPIIWFQDHFCFPIDTLIREKIENMNWNKLASERPWG